MALSGKLKFFLSIFPANTRLVPGLGDREDLRDIDRILPHLLDHLPRRITDRTAGEEPHGPSGEGIAGPVHHLSVQFSSVPGMQERAGVPAALGPLALGRSSI
jgi:hypothetical protein